MWGGLAVALVGFMARWTVSMPFGLIQYLNQEIFETLGQWLMRAGFTVAAAAAAAHLVVS